MRTHCFQLIWQGGAGRSRSCHDPHQSLLALWYRNCLLRAKHVSANMSPSHPLACTLPTSKFHTTWRKTRIAPNVIVEDGWQVHPPAVKTHCCVLRSMQALILGSLMRGLAKRKKVDRSPQFQSSAWIGTHSNVPAMASLLIQSQLMYKYKPGLREAECQPAEIASSSLPARLLARPCLLGGGRPASSAAAGR